jgi:hypothetical protein
MHVRRELSGTNRQPPHQQRRDGRAGGLVSELFQEGRGGAPPQLPVARGGQGHSRRTPRRPGTRQAARAAPPRPRAVARRRRPPAAEGAARRRASARCARCERRAPPRKGARSAARGRWRALRPAAAAGGAAGGRMEGVLGRTDRPASEQGRSSAASRGVGGGVGSIQEVQGRTCLVAVLQPHARHRRVPEVRARHARPRDFDRTNIAHEAWRELAVRLSRERVAQWEPHCAPRRPVLVLVGVLVRERVEAPGTSGRRGSRDRRSLTGASLTSSSRQTARAGRARSGRRERRGRSGQRARLKTSTDGGPTLCANSAATSATDSGVEPTRRCPPAVPHSHTSMRSVSGCTAARSSGNGRGALSTC